MSDPGIILAAGNIQGPTADEQRNNLVSMFSLAQQVQQAKQETAKKNALLTAFSDPNSVDPTTGTPTPQAIRKVMAVDPQMGLKLQDDALGAQVKRAQAEHYKTEAGKNNFDFMASTAGIGYDAYDAAKQAGKPEAEAVAAGQAARNSAVKNNGGVIGDDIADGILSKPFDPNGAKALAGANKEWLAGQTEKVRAKTEEDRATADRARADAEAKRLDLLASRDPSGQKWQILTDPKSNTQYRYNPETGQSTSLDGKSEYAPGGAAKISSGTGPRSAATAYIQKYMSENPNATSQDIAKAASNFAVEQSEGRTVGTRSGAADVAANEVTVFAKQALDASKKVKRPDLKLLTAGIQAGQTQDSNPDLQQLLIATDALVNARARAISPTGQPHVGDQIEGRKLLSTLIGQKGYEAGVAQFQKEAEGVLESTRLSKAGLQNDEQQSVGGKTKITNAAEYNALPSGKHFIDPKGIERVKP